MVKKSILFSALTLAACVSQAAYREQAAELEEARAQATSRQAEIAEMQAANRWVVTGDLLFPAGSYQLSPGGEATLAKYLPQLRSLRNSKVIICGFTDGSPVGPALERAGVADNLELSSRRADAVVAYFRSQGIDSGMLSAKGFGETRPIAPNDTPEARARNRRIEIVIEGAGA